MKLGGKTAGFIFIWALTLLGCQAPDPIALGGGGGSGGNPTDPVVTPTPGPTPPPDTCDRATLTWVAPTQNVDGTPLTNLAGFKIYWGLVSRNYSDELIISNPGATTVQITGLTPGVRYYFAAKAFNTLGVDSDYSGEVNKLMQGSCVAALRLF
jgi:hypothetical protein